MVSVHALFVVYKRRVEIIPSAAVASVKSRKIGKKVANKSDDASREDDRHDENVEPVVEASLNNATEGEEEEEEEDDDEFKSVNIAIADSK
jgi:stringent starvation protein B